MKISILIYNIESSHSTNWSLQWKDYCVHNEIDYEIIDPYDSNIIQKLKNTSIVLWHISGYSFSEMLISRSILYAAKNMGKAIFPDFNDAWHFDDKIAETYLLQSVNAPIPKSYMFYNFEDFKKFTLSYKDYPTIAKLRNGSGSHNVKLINSSNDLISYAKKMFSKGISSSPSLFYKSTSNIKSAKSLKTILNRAKRVPEFLSTLKNAKEFPNEKGYVFLQEFIPNDGYDLKVIVIGDKLSFIGRNIRKGEFRASGGGDLFYDKKYITKNIIDSAFKTSDDLGFNCMGYDYVVNKETNLGYIIEISFGFSHEALLAAGGFYDRAGNWHNEPLNAPKELLHNLILKVTD
jgi:glutathione synthase/RimK-type ligase-like ATP-grasp enzyme